MEKVRLATLNEMVSAQFVNEALEEVEDELQGGRITVEGEAAPQAWEAPAATRRSARATRDSSSSSSSSAAPT